MPHITLAFAGVLVPLGIHTWLGASRTRRARRRYAAGIGLLLAALAGCGDGEQTQAAGDTFKVVTTFTVIADLARNVAGDAATVVSVTKPGAEIHGYEPTPGDLVRASDADLLLHNGMNLELWFEQFLNNLGEPPAVTVSEGIGGISIASGAYAGKPNPHAWMSPRNAQIYVDNIAAALAEHDPDNADLYRRNAQDYKDRIAMAAEPLRDAVSQIPEPRRWLVTCEGAFSYLARDFGLRELYLWPVNSDELGTPKQVKRVIDGVRENDIPAVFCESTVSDAPARQVVRDTGAAFGGILYVDSLSGADGPVPTYLDLLSVTTRTIAEALAGGS